MKKLGTGLVVVAVSLVAAAPAGAQGQGQGEQGCGDVFRLGAAPGFGQAVSDAAKSGGFDDEVRLICRQLG